MLHVAEGMLGSRLGAKRSASDDHSSCAVVRPIRPGRLVQLSDVPHAVLVSGWLPPVDNITLASGAGGHGHIASYFRAVEATRLTRKERRLLSRHLRRKNLRSLISE